MQDKFHGVVPAVATPFTRTYDVDYGALKDLIRWYLESGVHGISVCGSQGEFFALDAEERKHIVRTTVETVNGTVPVYAGTGAITTSESIALTDAARSDGVDLVMVITPFFINPSADELVTHYAEIAKSTSLPLMIYNNPPRTGVNVTPPIYARCLEAADNIAGIKDSSGDITQISEYIAAGEGRKLLFAGRDTVILSSVIHGGSGAISPAANVFPSLVIRLYEASRAGDLDEARRISDILAPLRQAWAWGSFPVVIKEAMTLAGHSAGPARPPIGPIDDGARKRLAAIVKKIEAATEQLQASAA
jgi:4-hydroxy-tetrahydrodipicolinate synthase